MRKPRIDGQETRKQLLLAGGEVFAARGFYHATLAEICRKAGANIAAANYHFGNKETLYVECWRFSFDHSLKTYPPDGGVAEDAPVEERLRGRILAIMRRIIDPRNHDLDIVYKETANPTGLLAEAIQKSLEPVFRGLMLVIRELLGPRASDQQVLLCLMSIRSQCFGPLMQERRRKSGSPGPPLPLRDLIMDDVEALAEHVTSFSLAGIRAMRAQIEKPKWTRSN
ncbi:MAG: CerR family C-terminal domain-containing protein [Desulfobacteraceae bacterium]|nr:CerR family C-terminal domain-containing protein [Desulfobacteraceae bacterium]